MKIITMKRITMKQIINVLMFLYILSIYLFTYREGLHYISNAFALLLMAFIWIRFLLIGNGLVLNKFLLLYFLFLIISIASIFYAIDQSLAMTKVRTLVLLFLLMFSFINYIDTSEKLFKLMRYFVYSGFITSIYILLNADFSRITRFGEEIGNVNAVGLMLSISTVFGFYFIVEERKYLYIPIIAANSIVILLTGSRKSLVFIVMALIMVLISKRRESFKDRVKVIFGSIVIVLVSYYLIYNVPIFYQVIGRRMDNLLLFLFGEGTKEGSINNRVYMMQVGLSWFKERPFIGYGIDNYRLLFSGVAGGRYTYSHNNIIELLVGIGLIGTLFYYLTNVIVLIDLIRVSKRDMRTLCYSFIAIIFSYMLMSIGLVYYYEKHINILLAVGSVIQRTAKTGISEEYLKSKTHKFGILKTRLGG